MIIITVTYSLFFELFDTALNVCDSVGSGNGVEVVVT